MCLSVCVSLSLCLFVYSLTALKCEIILHTMHGKRTRTLCSIGGKWIPPSECNMSSYINESEWKGNKTKSTNLPTLNNREHSPGNPRGEGLSRKYRVHILLPSFHTVDCAAKGKYGFGTKCHSLAATRHFDHQGRCWFRSFIPERQTRGFRCAYYFWKPITFLVKGNIGKCVNALNVVPGKVT